MSFSMYDFDETLKGCNVERTDIKRVIAAYGVTEAGCCDDCGGEWSGGFLMEMKSGKFLFLSGWCDYTGWGCQDGTDIKEFDTEPALETLDQGYGKKEWETTLPDLQGYGKKEWETTLPDLQRYIETGKENAQSEPE